MFATWCALAEELEADPRNMLAARIAQLRALAASFGLEPSARSRLSVSPARDLDDPAERFFAS
jgi:phage terminase small subunit